MDEKPVMLITGARKGIGKYLAEYYCEKQFIVEGCSRKDTDFSHSNYSHHIVDVANEAMVRNLIASIRKRHGRLNIAINNAGVASMNHFMLMPLSSASKIVNTNIIGTFLVCREAAKLMKKSNYGRIVNFTSIATPMAIDGEAVYAGSKAGIETFSKVIAKELGGYGITCNVIGPTPVKTDLIKAVPEKKLSSIISRLAIRRFGKFEDISNVVDFFISPQSSYITAQVIYLGGL